MTTHYRRMETLEDLRRYVNEMLCDHDQLVVGAFQMTERLLTRCDRPCGVYFCLHGPRSVRFSAIWDALRNIVLFYGAGGERFHMTTLTAAPQLAIA